MTSKQGANSSPSLVPTLRSRQQTQRVVLVSGAGSGIGEALARRFAQDGCTVIGCGRNVSRLNEVRKEIKGEGGTFIPVRCDVRVEANVLAAWRKINKLGRVDILVNNAGVTYFKDFASTTMKEFDEVMETNVRGMFLLSKAVLPSMMKRRKGLIINILSFAAKTLYTGSGVYSASKSAGEAMMNVLREEVRGKGIKILNVYPGATVTPMWSAKHRSQFSRRMILPAEVADYVVKTANAPDSMMVEEIVFRPQQGDLKV